MFAPQEPPTSVKPAPAVNAAQPMETDAGGKDTGNDLSPLQIVQRSAEQTVSENRRISTALDSSTAESTTQCSAVTSSTERKTGNHDSKSVQTQQVVQPRTTRKAQRRVDTAAVDTDIATAAAASAEANAPPPVELPSTTAAERVTPANKPASKSLRPPLVKRRTSPRKMPTK